MVDRSDGPVKRRRRFSRSKQGCLTCKQRKVKCDERRPTCLRCEDDARQCFGFPLPSSSPRHTNGRVDRGSTCNSATSSLDVDGRISRGTPNERCITGLDELAATAIGVPPFDDPDLLDGHTHFSDWLDMICEPSSDLMAGPSSSGNLAWMAISEEELHVRPDNLTPAPSTSMQQAQAIDNSHPFHYDHQADARLQARLRSLCTSTLQLDAIGRFFNFVVQCFHLLPSSQNSWRRVYAQLCIQSRLVFKLTTSVGIVSLSLQGTIQRRPLAYALLAQCLAEWQDIVKGAMPDGVNLEFHELAVLEVLAGAILIGHFEQFDVGLSSHSNDCIRSAHGIINAVLKGHNRAEIDMNSGSPFRFLVKSFLWWKTLSRTMEVGAADEDTVAIFDAVHQWEERGENVLDSTQCITGWPISLLEAVSKVQSREVSKDRDGLAITAIEAQITSCRPLVVPQDDLLTAELRFVIFEILAAGVLIYLHRTIHGHAKKVQREVNKVVSFLGKRDRESETTASTPSRGSAGAWKERAPDGSLVWSYLQATMTVTDRLTQIQCERMFTEWIAYNDCAALNIELSLLKAMWATGPGNGDLNQCYKQVCQARRWSQPLIF